MTIGIIGGAGPMAGVLMFEQIIKICQTDLGLSLDHEFPFIQLISYPFVEMLSEADNTILLENQLEYVSKLLNVDYFAIACNTLHLFTKKIINDRRFVSLMDELSNYLKNIIPLVICSGTSRNSQLHKKFFACEYVQENDQKTLNDIINLILKGVVNVEVSNQLSKLLTKYKNTFETVILGCTEFSLLHDRFPISIDLNIIDSSSFDKF